MKHVAFATSRSLNEEEWRIVEIARTDDLHSLNPDGFFSRLIGTLFGIRAARPLANERLEALRRFAVRAWHTDLIPTRHLCEFLDAGFSPRNVRQILAYAATYRGFTPSVQDWVA
jgi:hypothetical protein